MPSGRWANFGGQQVVLEEVLLDAGVAAQVLGDARGEEAVAQPAGPFARGAIHEDVERVLAEGLAARGEEPVEPFIAGGELRLPDAGARVFAEIEVLHFAIALQHDELQVAEGVGLEGLQIVGARLQVVADDVDAAQALEVHVAIGKDFVEGQEQARGLLRQRTLAPMKPVRLQPKSTICQALDLRTCESPGAQG